MANDVYDLEVLGSAGGEPVSNVMSFELQSGGVDMLSDINALFDGWEANIASLYLDCMATDYLLMGLKAHRINNGGSPTVARSEGAAPGTSGHNGVQASAGALILSYYHSDPTPKFPAGHVVAGKMFLPYAPDTWVMDNTLVPAYTTAVHALITALDTPIVQAGRTFAYVVWSKTFNKTFSPFERTVSSKIGIQRRRLLPVL